MSETIAPAGVAQKPRRTLTRAVIRFAGDSGDGMQVTGEQFTTEAAWAGNDISTLPNFPAEIRAPAGTLFGVSSFQLQFGSQRVYTPGDQLDATGLSGTQKERLRQAIHRKNSPELGSLLKDYQVYPGLQRAILARQDPVAIAAGAFHNDVVAVSHHHHLFCHEQAFLDQANVLAQLQDKMSDQPLQILQVKAADIPLDVAISTYLFNSQIVTAGDGSTCMILPAECEDNVQVKQYVAERIVGSGFVQKALYVDVRQSMRNGGGPACLRLRVVLSSDQAARLENRVIINRETIEKLRQLIQAEYPVHMDVTFLRDAETVTHLNHVVGRVYRMLGIPVDF